MKILNLVILFFVGLLSIQAFADSPKVVCNLMHAVQAHADDFPMFKSQSSWVPGEIKNRNSIEIKLDGFTLKATMSAICAADAPCPDTAPVSRLTTSISKDAGDASVNTTTPITLDRQILEIKVGQDVLTSLCDYQK